MGEIDHWLWVVDALAWNDTTVTSRHLATHYACLPIKCCLYVTVSMVAVSMAAVSMAQIPISTIGSAKEAICRLK